MTKTYESSRTGSHLLEVNDLGGKQSASRSDWSLLPDCPLLRDAIEVLTVNCTENGGDYPRNNWKKVDTNSHMSHAFDHLFKSLTLLNREGDPEVINEELSHALCRMMFISAQLNEV
jgi:hypothetical protein